MQSAVSPRQMQAWARRFDSSRAASLAVRQARGWVARAGGHPARSPTDLRVARTFREFQNRSLSYAPRKLNLDLDFQFRGSERADLELWATEERNRSSLASCVGSDRARHRSTGEKNRPP